MSNEAIRAVALTEAVKTVGSEGADKVLAVAAKYDAFLAGTVAAAAPAASAGKPAAATKPAATKPAKPTKPAKTEEQLAAEALAAAEAEAAAEGGEQEYTQDDVAAVVDGLLKAGKRPEAVALLKKYKATSVSKVPADSYAAFVTEGKSLLPSEEDLTA